MKEQPINERQSLDIITEMIAQTKSRLHLGDGNIMLMWGYLTVSVAGLVWILLYTTHNPVWNYLWFLIGLIGGIATPVMARRQRNKATVKNYTDRLINGIWSLVSLSAVSCTAICFGLILFAGKNAWDIMLVFALLIVGMVESVQGIVIREKSHVGGGMVGMLAGIVTMACIAAKIALDARWFMPVFIFAWICMMIVPGHILNAKARKAR